MGKLYLLCGIPGSGKSFWIQNHINAKTDKWLSRDEIRFSIVQENEDYFSHEKEVFKQFVSLIDEGLKQNYNVFADATHLNETSRNKILRSISERPSSIECIWMRTPFKDALERNEMRKNTKSYVPQTAIRNMNKSLTPPQLEEGFSRIYIIEPNKIMQILEKA